MSDQPDSDDEDAVRFYIEEMKERIAYLKYIKTRGYEVDEDQILRSEQEIHELEAKLDESESNLLDERAVAELQRELAYVDLFDNDDSVVKEDGESFLKALLYKLQNIKLKMRQEQNHRRPHFHIEYKTQYAASYAVDTFERLAGEMPRKYEKPILKWAAQRPLSLLATWNSLIAGEDVRELVIVLPETR